jgi:hypothetical protein
VPLVKHLEDLVPSVPVSDALARPETAIKKMVSHLQVVLINLCVLLRAVILRFCFGFRDVFCEFHRLLSCGLVLGFWRLANRLLRCLALICLVDQFDILSELLNGLLLHPGLLPFLAADVRAQPASLVGCHRLLDSVKVLLGVRLVISTIHNGLAGSGCGVELGPRLALDLASPLDELS